MITSFKGAQFVMNLLVSQLVFPILRHNWSDLGD